MPLEQHKRRDVLFVAGSGANARVRRVGAKAPIRSFPRRGVRDDALASRVRSAFTHADLTMRTA
jgi:hypothetical protein